MLACLTLAVACEGREVTTIEGLAATLIRVSYIETPAVTTIDQGRADAYDAERIFGGLMPGRTARGDVDAGLAAAQVRIDAPFRFAANHHNPIEMLTTTAVWDGDRLTLYDSCQGSRRSS